VFNLFVTGPESLMTILKRNAPQSSDFLFEDFMLIKDPLGILHGDLKLQMQLQVQIQKGSEQIYG
jgi:hypothetical protein